MITFPIKRGTARRLGIRQPKPFAAYRQRWTGGLNLVSCCRSGRVAWPDPCPWHGHGNA